MQNGYYDCRLNQIVRKIATLKQKQFYIVKYYNNIFSTMTTITHIFPKHQRIENGVIVSTNNVLRQATFEYDATGTRMTVSIIPSLSSKRARLVRQDDFTLYYKGDDSYYRFVLECWPDNGTIKRFSVFRDDIVVEYRYISDHQDALY